VSSSLPELPEGVDDVPPESAGATITPYRDGPLIVRGDFRLLDQDGSEIDPGRQTIALCRCGKSGIKPFCDGTHKRSGFSAPSAPSRPRPAAEFLRAARRPES
jgi:CDGSH-type Zn-finger protein